MLYCFVLNLISCTKKRNKYHVINRKTAIVKVTKEDADRINYFPISEVEDATG